MKAKVFRFTATLLALQLLPGAGFSSVPEKNGNHSGPVVVALVPISERPSEELKRLTEELELRLAKTKGIRVIDRNQTNDMLDYYRAHVGSIARMTSQNTALTSARELVREARYREAEKYLDEVEALLEGTAGPRGDDLAQVYILRAKIYHSRNQRDSVHEQFEKLARINPDFEFDARLYEKWALKGLKQAKEKVLSAGTGSLTVTSAPEACDVFVNGFHKGLTPLSVGNLPLGRHIVEVRTVNHKPSVHEIQVSAEDNFEIKETLKRQRVVSKAQPFVALSPLDCATDEELSRLISSFGYHLGADKVVLLTEGEDSKFAYRLGDTRLGAIQNLHEVESLSEGRDHSLAVITDSINSDARVDILKNPERYADQTVGSVALHEKRKSPFYKKPLFWVLVGAGAGTGGVLAAVLGGAAAVIGPGGILIGL